MPDTPARQDAFGQSPVQRPGGGVPVARLLGRVQAGPGLLLKRVVAPRLTHALAHVQAVHPRLQPGDVRVAERGRCSYAHRARLVQVGLPAVRRLGARQMVDCTPGRSVVRPHVRRTSAAKGVPRSGWLTALGHPDPRVAWLKPKTWPSGLTREAWAALPATLVRRELRARLGTPGFRTRQIPVVPTWLRPEVHSVADLAARYRQRGQVETALAQLKTTMPTAGLHGKTVPGVLKALTVVALVDNLVRLVMGQAAIRQHLAGERSGFLAALRWLNAP